MNENTYEVRSDKEAKGSIDDCISDLKAVKSINNDQYKVEYLINIEKAIKGIKKYYKGC